jgi:hypothetical protein
VFALASLRIQSQCTYFVCCFRRRWHPKPILEYDTGKVDLTAVVMSNGKALVRPGAACLLCGHSSRLLMRCSHPGCSYIINGVRMESAFHLTCARQAGFEVGSTDDGEELIFYGTCTCRG